MKKMKKLMMAVAAFGMLLTSCQNDLDFVPTTDENSTVSFAVGTPEISTRAYSDGATATILQYAVYDAEGNILSDLTETDATINGSTTVKLQLTTGNTYSVIFWAAAPQAPYTVDFDAKTMTVDYSAAVSNAENRDAFFKYHTFTVKGAQTETIELKRPFAQLNIGAADYAASASAGYTPTQSAVVVKNVYSTLNLASGAVSDDVVAEFALADIKKDETFPVAGNEYLAMNYLLVGADKETVEVEFSYTDGSNAKTRTVGSVPVQRNYRTNIYGKLLTSDVDINVEIEPVYVDDFNWSVPQTVSTSAELVAALQTAVAAGETNIVFDANGANIGNFNKDDNTWFTTNLVPTGVTVTLRNATVSGISRWNNANGTLIFENCTFTNNSAYSINFGWGNGHVKFTNCELYGWCSFSGVTVEMNDCNIAGNGSYALVRSYNTFTMNNCTIDGSNAIKDDDYPDGVSIGDGAVLTMTGCTMTDAEYDYGESLIDGNRVVDYGENSSYIIVDGKRLVCNPSSLEYALKNGNAILMENNITVEAHLTNTSHGTNINIDGGGNELTLRGIYGVSGANVSLSNMTLVDSKTDDYTIFNQGGKIELNNVTYNSTINKAFQMAGGGDVVLTDCNISGDVTGTYSASNIWCGDGRNVTVNGGTYGSIFMNAQYHSGWPAASAHAASKITLNDGTITKLTLETELGAEGYYVSATLTQNGGTITNLVENPQNLDLTGRSQYNK